MCWHCGQDNTWSFVASNEWMCDTCFQIDYDVVVDLGEQPEEAAAE